MADKNSLKDTIQGCGCLVIIVFIAGAFLLNSCSRDDSSSKDSSSESRISKAQKASESSASSSSEAKESSEAAAKSSSFAAEKPIVASYGQLVKSNDYTGKKYVINSAHVLQAQEQGGDTSLLAYINDDPSKLFLIIVAGKTPAIEDDIINANGIISKLTTYKTNIGGSNTVPTIVSYPNQVKVIGHNDN